MGTTKTTDAVYFDHDSYSGVVSWTDGQVLAQPTPHHFELDCVLSSVNARHS